jgi:hypothetical protein
VVKGVSLFSGSLASQVATRLVERSPGVDEVLLLHFRSPFFEEYDGIREIAKSEWPGVGFRTQSLKKDYRHLANIPPGGSFSLRRSCSSCRRLILSRAVRYMRRLQADFLITGEIVGEHGLLAEDMECIAEDLGIADVLLRPLSARLLPPTRPEEEGWIDRSCLGDLTADDAGQLGAIAEAVGLSTSDPMCSELRCKLTSPGFGRRLEILFEEEGFTMNSLKLLDFRLYYKRLPDVNIVLATDEGEKRALQNFFLPRDLRVYLPIHRGPMTLVRTEWEGKSTAEVREIIKLAGRITATHSDAAHLGSVPVSYRFESDDETLQSHVVPFASVAEIEDYCLVPHPLLPVGSRPIPRP